MKRKRKPYFPPSRGPKAPAPVGGPAGYQSTTAVAIDLNAGIGRKDVLVGSRVTILGTGLYAGQVGVVERLFAGGIHAALVRVETGAQRRAQVIVERDHRGRLGVSSIPVGARACRRGPDATQ